MIHFVTSENKRELLDFCSQNEQNPFSCKIASAVFAYGIEYPFAQFWIQTDLEHNVVTSISKLDNSSTICISSHTDYEELRTFLAMLNAEIILCDAQALNKFGNEDALQGEIMVYHADKHEKKNISELPSLKEIHELLCACKSENFCPPEFEPFYLDISHRVRHGAAQVVGIKQDGKLIACAMTTAQTEKVAVISAVAVHPQYRKQGHGSKVVCNLIEQLTQNNIYIFRAENENELFYRSLGYEPCGRWAEIKN